MWGKKNDDFDFKYTKFKVLAGYPAGASEMWD